jgi:replicative DNA helicase
MIDAVSPPNDLEAEQAVLSSMLQSRGAITSVIEFIHAEDFYKEAHRWIFISIVELFEGGKPVDIISVTDRLLDKNLLDDVGGAS